MTPYTAGDRLQAITRAHADGSTAAARDRIAVALHRQRHISPAALRNLYSHTDGSHPASQADLAALLAAGPVVGAWDGERLVGFARAVSDGRLAAYVEIVVLDRQYREHGLSHALMARLLAELEHVAVVNLRGESGAVPFYEKQGFQPVANVLLQRSKTERAA